MTSRLTDMHARNLRVFPSFIAASLIAVGTVHAQERIRTADEVIGMPFHEFLRYVSGASAGEQDSLLKQIIAAINSSGNALVTDSSVHLLYRGSATSVSVPSDMNGWQPGPDRMTHLAGTDIFHFTLALPREARLEYKFIVDSVWILDPANPRQTLGGYGYNSELWMPGYRPPSEITEREKIPRGSLDTLIFASDTLRRTHPVVVYLPPGYGDDTTRFQCIWVTDGGEYLTLGSMNTVLDNMIHDQRIHPVVAIFVDPRTDPNDSGTSRRMEDYVPGSSLLNALISELRPMILDRYRVTPAPSVIMGASLGGLFSTYASVTHPEIFYGAAAQSPAYWWDNGVVFDLVRERKPTTGKFYIDTGTISDAQAESSRMYRLMRELGCQVTYSEHPEGHNWANWSARIDSILEYFFRAGE